MYSVNALQKSLRRLLWGMFFLMNPLFSFVDVLPDFIGCLFLFSAFRPFLFLDVRMQSARRSTRLILLLSLVRFLLTPVFFWSYTTDGGNTTMLLSFTFGVLATILELSVVKNVFETYNYLSVRCNSELALPHLDSAFSLLSLFFICQNLGSALPDLLTLFSPDSTLEYNPGSARAAFSFSFAKMLSYFALFVAVLIFAVVVYARLKRYLRYASVEVDYLERVGEAALASELGGCKLKLRFDVSGALALLTLSALFSVDYYFDYVSILPAPVAVVTSALVLYRLRAYQKTPVWQWGVLGVSVVLTLASYVYRLFYSKDVLVGATFYLRPFTVVFGVCTALCLAASFAASRIVSVCKAEAGIDLAPARGAACAFCLFATALGAYNYILPKGAGVTDMTEAIAFFALAVGAVFVAFAYRLDSLFQKESTWKFF